MKIKKSSPQLILLQLAIALIVAGILSFLKLDGVEAYLYDFQFRMRPFSEKTPEIELILIRSSTIEKLNREPRLTDLQKLIELIQTAKPINIGIDRSLQQFQATPAEAQKFNQWADQTKYFQVMVNQLELKGDAEGLSLDPPFDRVPLASAPKTSDLKIFAKDGVTRRMLVAYQETPLFHFQVAQKIQPQLTSIDSVKGIFDFADSQQIYINFQKNGTFQSHTFEDVLNGEINPSRFAGKIVLIGSDTALSAQEYVQTPYSRDIQAMTTTEMHANMISTLVHNSAIKPVHKSVNFIILFFISILTIHVVLSLTPTRGLLVLGGTLSGYILLSLILFWFTNYSMTMAPPLLAIFLVYYFFIPYRLIVESRRSWEYYQKHQLLTQVEELKTNFISMMSHDLKTPIARITGMADLILRDKNTLSPQQREAVDTIKSSSDDLLKFINLILEYGRIESEGIELKLQTKDINKLVEEVIKKHEFLAKIKRIRIEVALEPLFPIQLDPELIKQVLSNLIENAIKYSPEETQITVTTRENESKVLIVVEDQGPGIPEDEINHIFLKFFRTKNHKASPIKGSGLGLYLAKYFTELHKGQIFVESTYGKGSIFKVELPQDLGGPDAQSSRSR